jgi:hypothetical protein
MTVYYFYGPSFGDRFSGPTIGLLFGGGVLAIVLSAIVFNFDRWKPVVAGLFVTGVALIWVGIFLSVRQTQLLRVPSGIVGMPDTMLYLPRHGTSERYLMYVILGVLPLGAAWVFSRGMQIARRRMTGAIPGLVKSGLEHFHHGNFDAAIAEFTRALEIEGDHAETYDRRGSVYFEKGDLDRALSDYNQAISLDPRLADAYLHRGLVHMKRGFDDLAVVDFDTSLSMQPHVLDGHLNRGICRFKLGDFQGAAADFRLILHLTNHSDYADPARHYLQQLGVPC